MQYNPIISFSLFTLLSIGLTACQKNDAVEHKTAQQNNVSEIKTLSIGYQKSALTLLIAKQQKFLEQEFPNTTIQWKEFPAGPQMLEALSVGALDLGFVGNTPPIFAQAAGKNIQYAAYEEVPIRSQALVIAENSPIKNLADLKGKKIAVQKGSSSHELLGKILEKAGLTWQDITPVWLPPADARAAFDQKAIDAWVIWDPFLSVAERDAHVKVLIDGSAFPFTYQYYISNPSFTQQHPDAIDKFISGANHANTWMQQNPQQTVSYYAQSIGQDENIAKLALDKRPKDINIRKLDQKIIASQQRIADNFYQTKLIPQTINIQSVTFTH